MLFYPEINDQRLYVVQNNAFGEALMAARKERRPAKPNRKSVLRWLHSQQK